MIKAVPGIIMVTIMNEKRILFPLKSKTPRTKARALETMAEMMTADTDTTMLLRKFI